MPSPINDDDPERDFTSAAVARRLDRVVQITKSASDRMEAIRTGFVDPPGPDEPAIRASLSGISEQAAHIKTVADELLLRIGR